MEIVFFHSVLAGTTVMLDVTPWLCMLFLIFSPSSCISDMAHLNLYDWQVAMVWFIVSYIQNIWKWWWLSKWLNRCLDFDFVESLKYSSNSCHCWLLSLMGYHFVEPHEVHGTYFFQNLLLSWCYWLMDRLGMFLYSSCLTIIVSVICMHY